MTTTSKIKGGSGFNEGGGTVFATNTGETKVISTEFNRDALPADEFRYGITEYEKISAGAATQELRAGIAGRQIEVLSYVFVVDAASTVTFKSAATAISGGMACASNGGASAVSADEQGLMITAVGEALNITNSAGNIAGHVTYRIV
tara:strand:+ start:761 stop:1201 length:441 start_codon:yes stop_codon:yes gene_type:complete